MRATNDFVEERKLPFAVAVVANADSRPATIVGVAGGTELATLGIEPDGGNHCDERKWPRRAASTITSANSFDTFDADKPDVDDPRWHESSSLRQQGVEKRTIHQRFLLHRSER